MNTQTIMDEFAALPPNAQQQVADFIEFLKQRYQPAKPARKAHMNLDQSGFVGIWHDRTDLKDSTQWVRNLRSSEWG